LRGPLSTWQVDPFVEVGSRPVDHDFLFRVLNFLRWWLGDDARALMRLRAFAIGERCPLTIDRTLCKMSGEPVPGVRETSGVPPLILGNESLYFVNQFHFFAAFLSNQLHLLLVLHFERLRVLSLLVLHIRYFALVVLQPLVVTLLPRLVRVFALLQLCFQQASLVL